MKAQDSYAIAAMMVKIEGWEKKGLRQRIPIYGMQRLYVRQSGPIGAKEPVAPSLDSVLFAPLLNELTTDRSPDCPQ
jgi:hypothetical protein